MSGSRLLLRKLTHKPSAFDPLAGKGAALKVSSASDPPLKSRDPITVMNRLTADRRIRSDAKLCLLI